MKSRPTEEAEMKKYTGGPKGPETFNTINAAKRHLGDPEVSDLTLLGTIESEEAATKLYNFATVYARKTGDYESASMMLAAAEWLHMLVERNNKTLRDLCSAMKEVLQLKDRLAAMHRELPEGATQ